MIHARSLLCLVALCQLASANPWQEIFKPLPGWQESTVADADGDQIKIQPGAKPFFFTNAANPKKAGYLQTVDQFGDCTVEAEFIIPKGSNSGIYLQGRYEVQILDSYGKDKVGYGDMGGIYQRVDPKRTPSGFDGHAPLVNAAKPAGEWQALTIKFRAPRLDTDGNLLEKPIILSVVLNGQTVQTNVTLHGPTNSAQRQGWAAKDHVFIQGDHGPIAFRKFKATAENFPKPE